MRTGLPLRDAAPPVDRGIEPNWKALKTELSEYIKAKPEKRSYSCKACMAFQWNI